MLKILLFTLIICVTIIVYLLYKCNKKGIACPKCGFELSVYHFTYKDINKEIDQSTYYCKNCGYRAVIKN